jgi:hypothetical protein
VDPKTGRTTFTNVPLRTTTSVTPKTTTAAPTRSPTRGPTPVAHASSQGRIARSAAAKHAFEVQTGYSHGRPGYVVDHVKPLACGSADTPSNMQWQTVAAGKAKDKVERQGCGAVKKCPYVTAEQPSWLTRIGWVGGAGSSRGS